MQRVKFDLQILDGEILRRQEKNLKYIKPFSWDNRNTYIDYVHTVVQDKNALVPVIKYKIFDKYDDIAYGFSTRFGGVSKAHLSSLNLSFSRGDDIDNVIINNLRFAKAVGYDFNERVFSDQVHDVKIRQVTREDTKKGLRIKLDHQGNYIEPVSGEENDIIGIDGLVTDEPGIPLITFYADCVPLYFYDPVKKVVGLAHSGWKGTVNKIGSIMVEKMKAAYGCNPTDIVCAIGPSICMDCYEVSQDVADQFNMAYTREELKRIMYGKEGGKYQLNLHEACKINFLNAGILEDNIAMPDLCTCCNPNVLFSHRASEGKRGNLAAVIMLKQ